jgi:hypothetical protein
MSNSIKSKLINQVEQFIKELVLLFPDNNDIYVFQEKYNFITSVNKDIILNYMIQYIYPHKTRIMSEDETFFLEGGGQEELKDNQSLKFRDNITKIWVSKMSFENKKIMWKYFKTFVLLIEKYLLENIKL